MANYQCVRCHWNDDWRGKADEKCPAVQSILDCLRRGGRRTSLQEQDRMFSPCAFYRMGEEINASLGWREEVPWEPVLVMEEEG